MAVVIKKRNHNEGNDFKTKKKRIKKYNFIEQFLFENDKIHFFFFNLSV